MSPLTKAFVVLVTILSILLVALVVPFVANTDALNDQVAELKNEVRSAEASARLKETEAATARAAQISDVETLQTRITSLLGDNAELKQAAAAKVADLKKAENQVESLTASQAILSESLNRTAELLSSRTTLLEQFQTKNVSLNQQNAELVQTNNLLAAQVSGLNEASRTLTEQLVEANERIENLMLVGPGGDPPPPGPTAKVLASVTNIQDVNGIKIVQFNVGANDQIKMNDIFVIYRNGDELVGTAAVKSVDQNASVAQLQTITQPVRVGDSAMSGLY